MTRRALISVILAAVLTAGLHAPGAALAIRPATAVKSPARVKRQGKVIRHVRRLNPLPKIRKLIQRAASRAARVDTGIVAGRFQVLHKDHVKFMMAGKKKCKHLIVGITNPDPSLTRKDAADPARSKAQNNPMTYFERYTLVRSALREAGLKDSQFSVVPLPVNIPKMYDNYIPRGATVFVTVYDKWGERKAQQFKDQGFKTSLLWKAPQEKKGISATTVRKAMVEGTPWEHYVPRSVARQMKKWDIPARLREMASGDLGTGEVKK